MPHTPLTSIVSSSSGGGNSNGPERLFPFRFSCFFLAVAVFFPIFLFAFSSCVDSRENRRGDLEEAKLALDRRDFLDAEKSFERYLRLNPETEPRWEVWNALVEIALNVRNDKRSAIELLETMNLEYGDDSLKKREIGMSLAELYKKIGNLDRAHSLWTAIADDSSASDTERAQARRFLAGIYLRHLDFDNAIESLQLCLSLNIPEELQAACLYDLAQAYDGAGKPDEAIMRLQQTLRLKNIAEDTHSLAVFMLADSLQALGKNDEALELFSSLLESYPNRKVIENRIAFIKKK